ncbi:MAG: GNAT family N-acetyltransferase [Actinobacteria bacterium]|nr:GNAT family N-acetyltransferase [Actinomycetota bacterium]
MIQVRSATSEDDQQIIALKALAHHEIAPQRGGPSLLATLNGPAEVQLVAELAGAIVGLAELSLNADRAVLSTLYVHPETRGVGVGHSLLNAATAEARTLGANHLDAAALPGDRETKNFFESHAMKTRLLIVHQEL